MSTWIDSISVFFLSGHVQDANSVSKHLAVEGKYK